MCMFCLLEKEVYLKNLHTVLYCLINSYALFNFWGILNLFLHLLSLSMGTSSVISVQ